MNLKKSKYIQNYLLFLCKYFDYRVHSTVLLKEIKFKTINMIKNYRFLHRRCHLDILRM